ncbi:GntR family transcriptional regulator [Salinibacterium sp. NSLL150]|uniref:GntR family transcriptional regulator n=1 Tax=unclassified Salinibacterium TaxID=2632331 RepID=UPI0018CDD1A0|nr:MULTISPECIES: GntR family transcriptional regulator [unclassified Salinibacterium]MBH0097601.1 GntR family transcriptional regulator [Salinibacterium sp. NSLL35]MBH0100356.1 GntR family transcriptional regulator [Salinibacterium sp. NSLL150]MBH0103115.1 GntR family transcriptional regulator [Salinibacterium sp. NSLL16]MBH0105876.1 GntR family transcriptional regulator [Salinibacterium sp. NSLL17]
MIENAAVLPETVAQKLRADIIAQRDAPGSAITESAVALRFGVARPTARIAIDRLVADGILRREAHRAARVPELSYDDVLDLFDTRSIVETAAMAALAEAGAIPAEALAAHRALTATDDFAHHDIQFHRALVAGQASSRLTRLHELLMGEVELCIGQVQSAQLITAHEVAEQHQGILDAITAGDAAAAEHLTRDHILGARDRLLTHLDTDTDLDTDS